MEGTDNLEKRETLPSSVSFHDIYTDDGCEKFTRALEKSQGNCLILVHPFHPLSGINRKDIDLKANKKLQAYLNELGELIRESQTNKARKLPVLVLISSSLLEKDDPIKIAGAIQRTRDDLSQIAQVDQGEFFSVLTNQSSPIPILSPDEGREYATGSGIPRYGKIVENFVNKLKMAGLRKALIAGANFGGRDWIQGKFSPVYFSAEYLPLDGLFRAGETKWKLADYYWDLRKKRGTENKSWRHPLELISPSGCVAEFIRALAYWGKGEIRFGLSRATYPQKLPQTNKLTKIGVYKVVGPENF